MLGQHDEKLCSALLKTEQLRVSEFKAQGLASTA